jgi:tRNA (guanine37-N1)-methyltransferase
MNNISIALIHYPVLNKRGEEVATSITPFDIHDISRSAYTFGVDYFYIVHSSSKQEEVLKRITKFWQVGYGKSYNESRSTAFSIVKYAFSFKEAKDSLEQLYKQKVKVIATTARKIKTDKMIPIEEVSKISTKTPIFILFGTGWGLADKFFDLSDYILKPIDGVTDYNHLSVRAASAIILYLLSRKQENSLT